MNNFHIYEEVGRGKYSVVYKGRRKKTIEYVAVKSVEKSRKKKVLNEVKILHNLNHPNVLKFHNWHETRNHLWLIFEYCAGGDLYHLLEQDKKIPEKSVIRMGAELATGLYYLHSKGVIYADLKPSNVIINEYNKLKLSDFGLARKVESADVDPTQQSGTPSYMAPELFQKQGVYSYASDLWSLGCVLFEMATGKPPFSSNSLKELVTQIMDAPTPRIEHFSKEFNDLLAELLEKDPVKRSSWEVLRTHPCWNEPLPELFLPSQPQFDSYLLSRGIHPSKVTEMSKTRTISKPIVPESAKKTEETASTISRGESSNKRRDVDLLRLSQTVKKNIMKDHHEYTGHVPEKDPNDIHLVSKDQELNFSERPDEDEDKTGSDKTPTDSEGDAKEIKETTQQLEGIASGICSIKSSVKGHHTAMRTIKGTTGEDDFGGKKPIIPATAPVSVHCSEAVPIEEMVKPLDQLLMHTSDTTVKPIIGNRDIEKLTELTYQPERLPFMPWKAEDFAEQVETLRFEKHVAEISKAIGSGAGVHVLAYFESIIQNTNVANKLINTMFITYLAKMLGTLRSTSLKVRACSVIGTLIRHATIIEDEVAESGICELLQDALKEKQEGVRRKAMAALGEYLFYAATQMDDEESGSVWTISPLTVAAVVRCIKPGEDEIVKSYACKTIENITSQSLSAGYLFSTIETASLLLNIFNNPKNETMRASAAVALSHICRLNASVFPTFFDVLGFANFCGTLADSLARIQQAFITLLLYAVKGSYPLVEKLYLQNPAPFIPTVIKLLESSSPVIKGKVLLTIALLVQNNILWLSLLGNKGVYQHIDRISKDSHKYLRSCLATLCDTIEKSAGDTLSLVFDDLIAKTAGKSTGRSPKSIHTALESRFDLDPLFKLFTRNAPGVAISPVTPFYGSLNLINVLKDMATSLTLKSRVVPTKSIKNLCEIFALHDSKEYELVQFAVLQVFETLGAAPKLLPGYCDVILQYLLPNLLAKVYSKNEELRCSCFKLVCDILAQFMSDENIYNPRNVSSVASKTINELILKQLLPKYGFILSDADPLPTFALKLLSTITECNIAFVGVLNKLKLLPHILEYYAVGHPRLNLHTVKIVKCVVEYGEIPLEELNASNIISKTNNLMEYLISNQQDWCLDTILDIIYQILQTTFKRMQQSKNASLTSSTINKDGFVDIASIANLLMITEGLIDNFEACMQLLSSSDVTLVEKSIQAIFVMLQLFGAQRVPDQRQVYFIEGHVRHLLDALRVEKPLIQKRALKCILFALDQEVHTLMLSEEQKAGIINAVQPLIAVGDKSVATAANKLVMLLNN